MTTSSPYLRTVTDNEAQTGPKPRRTGPRYVSDVMTARVVTVPGSAPFKEIVDALTSNRISAVPVVDEKDHVLGVVSESDLLARAYGGPVRRPRTRQPHLHGRSGRGEHASVARELMNSPAIVTTPEATIAAAARLTAVTRARRLPVVDSEHVLVGIVTRSDLLRPFLRSDSAVEQDIESNIIVGMFNLDPVCGISVRVKDGVAVLSGGQLEQPVGDTLVDYVRHVSGVIEVADRLTYRHEQPRWGLYDAMRGYNG